MKIGTKGLKLIKHYEKCQLVAYKCPSGKWTIGWGHTGTVDGKKICKGMKITKEKADELLNNDLERAEHEANAYNNRYDYDWTQSQFDAMCSFAFNVGNLNELTAGGTRNNKVIAHKMLLYNHGAGGVVLNGLTDRREREHNLFCENVILGWNTYVNVNFQNVCLALDANTYLYVLVLLITGLSVRNENEKTLT